MSWVWLEFMLKKGDFMKNDKITVELFAHWKQGDDFGAFLKEFSPSKALEMWGKSLIETGKLLIKGSEILAGQEIKADGDTHHISLYDIDRKLAENLFKLGIFYQDQWEKEHETCDNVCDKCSGCYECCQCEEC